MQSTRLIRVASRVVSHRRPPLSFVPSWTAITVSICEEIAPLFAVVETGPNLQSIRGGYYAQIYHFPDVVLGDRATPESNSRVEGRTAIPKDADCHFQSPSSPCGSCRSTVVWWCGGGMVVVVDGGWWEEAAVGMVGRGGHMWARIQTDNSTCHLSQ